MRRQVNLSDSILYKVHECEIFPGNRSKGSTNVPVLAQGRDLNFIPCVLCTDLVFETYEMARNIAGEYRACNVYCVPITRVGPALDIPDLHISGSGDDQDELTAREDFNP